ncbi:MAG TPA: ATP-dependent DNA ligase [Methylibium sp.]|uniref:ATP-dependent DNA ligase n=1 Tax=Methylibium sp. TaxID=2067992 RepID=UPI002DBBF5E6|nr:ATP-dependent DNA ligase [Methylibium sp.]HEU4459237.1 ATP-dependent DNA ligase [Methylibium sp.]
MISFARLYAELDASTSTLAKVAALRGYFERAAPRDAAWAAYFLAGGKPRQTAPSALLRQLACEQAGIADWLFDECYQAVGDLAETVALVLPPPTARSSLGLADWIEQRLLPLREASPAEQAARLTAWWSELDANERFLLVKLIGGGFRVGVSKLLVQRALAEVAGLDAKLVAQRMMGYTDAKRAPDERRFAALIAPAEAGAARAAGEPYPFFLAHQVEGGVDEFEPRLGPPSQWLVEWKYDGIRAQLVRRAGQSWLWSRGEELVTERYPEVAERAAELPDGTVLDGELLVWLDGRPSPEPFAKLQQRIGRKLLSKKLLAELPVRFVAYDLLEEAGVDLRERPQHERRARLEALLEGRPWIVSPRVTGDSWRELALQRAASRARAVEGLMLKHRNAAYGAGRRKQEGLGLEGRKGDTWLKWKIDPMSVDCVLVYAQRGHGRRASLYTDYSFAVWNRTPRDAAEAQAVADAIAARQPAQPGGLQLVPFAKAYSGLTDAEFHAIDRTIRAHTVEKFGPVRSVRPTLVFELGFEGIQRSPRHKSGIAVRFPRMLRVRSDKPLHEADTLASLETLLGVPADGGNDAGR